MEMEETQKWKLLGTGTTPGAAIYFPWLLNFVYDNLVLRFYNTYVWRCPTQSSLLPLFEKNISRPKCRLLDIGVGTGFYPEQAPLSNDSRVLLVDLNSDCLAVAGSRVRKAHPEVVCKTLKADILTSGAVDVTARDGPFDAVSVMFLLHCLPGPPARKAALLAGLKGAVEPENGVLFGSTILGKGVQHNFLGRFIMHWHNSWGIFDNRDDSVDVFIGALKEAFEVVEWRVVGTVLLFEARRPIV